jgi:hypothetical protein
MVFADGFPFVENIIVIYPNRSDVFPPISHCLFLPPNIDVMLGTPPT